MPLRQTLTRPLLTDLKPYIESGGPHLVFSGLLLAGAFLVFPFDWAIDGGAYPAAASAEAAGPGRAAFFACSLALVALMMLFTTLAHLHRGARDARTGAAALATLGAGALAVWLAAAPYWTLYLRTLSGVADDALAVRLGDAFFQLGALAPLALALFWLGIAMVAEAVLHRTDGERMLARGLAVVAGLATFGPFALGGTRAVAVGMLLAGCASMVVVGVLRTRGRPEPGPAVEAAEAAPYG